MQQLDGGFGRRPFCGCAILPRRIALVFRMAGLKGHALDEAIASVTIAAMDAIEGERQAKANRLASIRLV